MKHLVYLIDGTAQRADRRNGVNGYTNIYRLAQRIAFRDQEQNQQIVHYCRGIGGKNSFREIINALTGYGALETATDLYINICTNFQHGDKIYIIGYSRGAAVARVLAGLLEIGLLKDSFIDRLHKIIQTYITIFRMRKYKGWREITETRNSIEAEKIKTRDDNQLTQPDITFLGLFDSVPGPRYALGYKMESLMLDGHPSSVIKNILHVIAMNETRTTFNQKSFLEWPKSAANTNHRYEQIWMPGIHGDIGGGKSNGLSDFALALMIDRLLTQTDLTVEGRDLARKLREESTDYFIGVYQPINWLLSPLRKKREPLRVLDKTSFAHRSLLVRLYGSSQEDARDNEWNSLDASDPFISEEMSIANDAFR